MSDRVRELVRPGWAPALAALAVAAVTAVLVQRWAVQAPWLTIRGAVGGWLLVAAGLAVGSRSLVGMATVPVLAAATVGLDRPTGHAWGQALVLAVLWYVTCEVAWASIEARAGAERTPAIDRLRVREVAVVVVASVLVGVMGIALASMAPVRTATVRAAAIAIVLVTLAVLGRHLAAQATTPDRDGDQQPDPGGTRP